MWYPTHRTIDFDYNLKRLWVPPTRWSMMVRRCPRSAAWQIPSVQVKDRMGPPRRGSDRRDTSSCPYAVVQGGGWAGVSAVQPGGLHGWPPRAFRDYAGTSC